VKSEEHPDQVGHNGLVKLRAIKVRFAVIAILLLMAIVITPILGLTFIIPPLLIIFSMAFLSSIFWGAWGKKIKYRAYLATVIDIFLITVAVHYIGGMETPFTWIYAIALIAIGSLRGAKVGIFAAFVSSLMYSSLLIAEFTQVIPHIGFGLLKPVFLHHDRFYLFMKLLSDIILFFITATISGILFGRLIRYKDKLEHSKQELEGRNEQLRLEITERSRAEGALRESEEKYRGLFESSIESIFTVDLKGNLTSCNHATEEILGFPGGKLIGTSHQDYIVPEQWEMIFQAFNKLFQTGEPIRNLQYDIIRGDGEQRTVEGNVNLIGNNEHPTGFQITARDITDRNRAKEALIASEQRYRMVVEEAQDIICTVDMKTGIITNSNSFAERALGFKYADVVNKLSFIELIHPDDHERLFNRLRELAFEKNRQPNFPARLLKADGTFIHVEINGTVAYDQEGAPETFIGVIRDVTERKHAEQALRESEEKYRLVVENANEIIMIHQDGMVKYSNASTSKFTGYSQSELMAKPFMEFVHPDDCETVVEHHLRRLKGENFINKYNMRVLCKDGSVKWFEVDAVVIHLQGAPATLAFLSDITEQKLLEQQLRHAQKMESIGTLAGGIAHDFNNLLGGILGYASFMKAKMENNHPFFNYIDTIERSSMRAAELTSQLLAFARRGKYETKSVDLNAVIDETLKIIARTVDKSIEIETHLSPQIPTIEGDATQLQQIVMNLCVNAGDAMPSGGKLTVETRVEELTENEVRVRVEAKEGCYVALSITDTGFGMDREIQERIFEPFFTTKEEGKGTGLGLSMVYGAVKNHGGFMRVYSEPGLGSMFKAYLPVSGKPVTEKPPETEACRGNNELILVVDDEDSIRALARDMLEDNGYRVLLAENGEEAISVYGGRNKDISLVILDMVMPKMDGRETFLKLKDLNPGVKALLSTGYSLNGRAEEILNSGAIGFIQKPYRLNALLSKVRSVLAAGN